MKAEQDYLYRPDAEYRYFVHDPQGDTLYFKTVQDRDKAAQEMIDSFLVDGWMEEVRQIIAGEVTHHTVAKDVEIRPKREDFDSDDSFDEAMGDYPDSDFEYCCQYQLSPLEDQGEELPK